MLTLYMWNLKNKRNDIMKEKQAYRFGEQTNGYQCRERRGERKMGVGD